MSASVTVGLAAASSRPDLQALFDDFNRQYFHDVCAAHIRWGRAGTPKRRSRRSMLLGSYSQEDQTIRIHPALASPVVPFYVLGMVVFHEMLHEYFGTPVVNGRRQVHPPEFRAVESSHPDYDRALAWERAHLHKLLRLCA